MMTDDVMDAPRVQAVLSSNNITTQAAHDLLSRFLAEEHEYAVVEGGEELIRLDAVCQSLASSSTAATTPSDDDKKAKKSAKKSAKKERKEKRKREKESAKKSKRRKTS